MRYIIKLFTWLGLASLTIAIIGCVSGKNSTREEEAYIFEEDVTYGMGDEVTVTIDYRCTDVIENGKVKYTLPAQIHDVKCAVRWRRANAIKYRIDPDRIGTVEHSAGGHLASMLGLTDPSNGLEGACGNMSYSSRVQVVVSLAGPTELIDFYKDHPIFVTALLGGVYEEVPEQYTRASPLTYVSGDDPPVLIVRGEGDTIVPLKQAELLNAKMNEVGASHTFIVTKNADHGAYMDDTVWEFLDRHLK